jgi:hypothetical protein
MLILVSGCDPQADPDYQGEVLATVQGTIRSELSQPPDSCHVALIWQVTSGSPDYVVGQDVEVRGVFPTSFAIDLYTPPPTESLNNYDGSRVGVALVVVSDRPITDLDLGGDEPDGLLGGCEDYLVIYVENDIQPGTFAECAFGSPLNAGYYLTTVLRTEDPDYQAECERRYRQLGLSPEQIEENCGIFDLIMPLEAGFDTNIFVRLVNDLDLLDWPNWT